MTLALGLACVAAIPTTGQERVIQESSPLPYAIKLEPAYELGPNGSEDEDWVTARDISVLEDGRVILWEQAAPWLANRFVVATPNVPGGVSIGRQGEGPGEYAEIRWIRALGDRLYVFDHVLRRRTVLNAATFEVLHTNPIRKMGQLYWGATVLDDSSYVLNTEQYAPELAGYALHRFNNDGEVVGSFDDAITGIPGLPPARLLQRARGGGVWSASWSTYRIDLWDPYRGSLLLSLTRDVDWFPPATATPQWEVHPDRPASSFLAAFTEDAAGRLWVVLNVPNRERWADCIERAPQIRRDPNAHPEAPDPPAYRERSPACGHLGWKIEVLDPDSGHLLAALDLPAADSDNRAIIWGAAPNGFLFSRHEEGWGWYRWRFFEPRLSSP